MSRATAADTIVVKPSNNIYTVLVFVALLLAIGALLALQLKAKGLFDVGLI